jgi:hypothetical protein
MNTIRKGVEKSIEKLNGIPKVVKAIECEVLNLAIKWPPRTY